jgi:hypothetical protein
MYDVYCSTRCATLSAVCYLGGRYITCPEYKDTNTTTGHLNSSPHHVVLPYLPSSTPIVIGYRHTFPHCGAFDTVLPTFIAYLTVLLIEMAVDHLAPQYIVNIYMPLLSVKRS